MCSFYIILIVPFLVHKHKRSIEEKECLEFYANTVIELLESTKKRKNESWIAWVNTLKKILRDRPQTLSKERVS
jgi:hypothetical protein